MEIRVLTVDDEPDLSVLTKIFLERSDDLKVDIANSVREAFNKISEIRYDAIVSDYQMPEEDGIQFLKELRAKGDETPFILFTGKGREEVVIEALNNGADAYLQKGGKPVPQYAELGHRIRSIVRRHIAEEARLQSESKLLHAEEMARFGHWQLDLNKLNMSGSQGIALLCGLSDPNITLKDWRAITLAEYCPLLDNSMNELIESGKPYNIEFKIRRPDDGRIIDVHSLAEYDRERNIIFGVLQDITERKREQHYRDLIREILSILTRRISLKDSLRAVIYALKSSTGVEAVGIRLQQGNDFPYYTHEGFSNDFIAKETSLLSPCPQKDLCRDGEGRPLLECTCGLVVSGMTDPSNPLFTKGGSAWTNDSFPLLALPVNEDPRIHPRNECVHQGFASIALVPIKGDGKIIGLIQFNDRRRGLFSLENIELLEVIADNIGSALLRKQAEGELRKSESVYHGLFENIDVGVVLRRMVYDDNGKIIDKVLLNANPAALKTMGVNSLEEVVEKKQMEMFSPEIAALSIETLRKMKVAGQSVTQETHFDVNGRDYITTFIPIEDDYIITTSVDITERKRAEQSLLESERRYRLLMNSAPYAIVVHYQGNVLYANSAAMELYQADSFEQLAACNILDLIPPDEHESSHERANQAMRSKRLP